MRDHGFRSVMEQKTDEALLLIVNDKRKDYQPNAILDAEEILRERGHVINAPAIEEIASEEAEQILPEEKIEETESTVTLQPAPISSSQEESGEKKKLDLLPIVLWCVSLGILFFRPIEGISLLLFVLGVRAIAMLWIWSLCDKYGLNTTNWLIGGFIFGPMALLVLNFKTWTMNPVDKEDNRLRISAAEIQSIIQNWESGLSSSREQARNRLRIIRTAVNNGQFVEIETGEHAILLESPDDYHTWRKSHSTLTQIPG